MTEADLRDLGIHRVPIPVPFVQAGGPVNVYLVEDAGGGLLLFDAGLGTPDAEAALAEGFARAGRQFEEVGRGFRMARRIAEVTPLEPGETLHAGRVELEVHHMPGHTPGLLCLYERRRRVFFSGDHLLEKVSPNPIIELGPAGEEGAFRPLVAYLDSVGRLHGMDVDLVLPGHGAPFGQHRAVIDGLLQFYRKRQAKVREVLSGGPRTGHEVTRALFPRIGPGDLFLVVSETIANLEVLEARGEVSRELREDVYRFRLAG